MEYENCYDKFSEKGWNLNDSLSTLLEKDNSSLAYTPICSDYEGILEAEI